MAETVESLERDVAESRARLADTLDRLTSPDTAEAVKRDLVDAAMKAKDQLLGRARDTGRQTAQSYADSLVQRAMDNPLAVALIAAGIGWRLYKKPPVTSLLVGAGVASLFMSGGSARNAARDPYRDPRQGYVPGGVAGYGYPVEEDAPRPGLTERAGAVASDIADRARELGERARHAASAAAAQASEAVRHVTDEARGAASAVAARVSETAADVTDRTAEAVSHVRDSAAHAAGRVRASASETMTRANSSLSHVRSDAAQTARDMTDRAADIFHQAQRSPVLLGAAGFMAGLALARSARATAAGGRALDRTADVVGGGARRAASVATGAAGRAADALSAAAAAAAEAASSTYDQLRERTGDAYQSARETASSPRAGAAGRPRRGGSSGRGPGVRSGGARRAPGLSRQFQDQVYELGREYPVLLGAVGLAVGAALGGTLYATATENRLFGDLSDDLKQRARELAGKQYAELTEAAAEFADQLRHRFEEPDAGAAGRASTP